MKVRQITKRDRWRLTTHLRGLYGMVSLQRRQFWMVRSESAYRPRARDGRHSNKRIGLSRIVTINVQATPAPPPPWTIHNDPRTSVRPSHYRSPK